MKLNTQAPLNPWEERRKMFLKGDTAPIQQTTLTDEENNFADYGFNYTLGADNEELRAQNQTTAEKYLHGLGKAGILFGTTLADGIIGTVVGGANLATSIAEGDPKLSAYWNNDFTNTIFTIDVDIDFINLLSFKLLGNLKDDTIVFLDASIKIFNLSCIGILNLLIPPLLSNQFVNT